LSATLISSKREKGEKKERRKEEGGVFGFSPFVQGEASGRRRQGERRGKEKGGSTDEEMGTQGAIFRVSSMRGTTRREEEKGKKKNLVLSRCYLSLVEERGTLQEGKGEGGGKGKEREREKQVQEPNLARASFHTPFLYGKRTGREGKERGGGGQGRGRKRPRSPRAQGNPVCDRSYEGQKREKWERKKREIDSDRSLNMVAGAFIVVASLFVS